MEEHKRRAVAHLLKRSGKPLTAYIAAVEEVAEQLEAAYGKDLGKEWRGENRRRFVEMMVTDGCFLMELIQWGNPDYVPESGDPFFSEHSFLYMSSIITSDVLVMENQLPLLVIRSLFAVGYGVAPSATTDKLIHQMVLHCLGRGSDSVGDQPLALHPVDLYHSSLTFGGRHDRAEPGAGEETMPRAVEIHEAGVHFRTSDTDSLLDVHFNDGMLYMPTLVVDDEFERIFLNLLAFERLHAGAGNDVTAYMFFMDNVVDEAEDVSLLRSKGILQNYLGSDKPVAKLFNDTLSKGTVLSPSSAIGHVTYMLEGGFSYHDFSGHKGTINTGDVQWMTAGRGVVHAEVPGGLGVQRGLNLWINLSSKDKMYA